MGDRLAERMACMAVFARVVEAGSFSAAASALGLSKSAVSKQVARLETLTGSQLLRRTTRSIGLTEAGRLLYERAQEAIALCEDASRQLASLKEDVAGLVRVSAPVTFGQRCLVPLLPALLARHPALEVQLELLDRPVDLAQDGFDLAVRLTRALPAEVVARRLMVTRYVLCAAQHAAPTLSQPRDLLQVNCLRYGASEPRRDWHFTRGETEEAVAVTGSLAVNSSESLRSAMLAGLGVALLPEYVIDADLRSGAVVELLPEWRASPVFGHHAYALWLPHRHVPTRVRAVLDFLTERLDQSLAGSRATLT